MLTLVEEITGKRALHAFSPAVIADKEAARCLRRLHEAVMGKACTLHREKLLLLLISLLLAYVVEVLKRVTGYQKLISALMRKLR